MYQRFQTHTTRSNGHGQLLCELLATATQAADPGQQIAHILHTDTTQVVIGTEIFTPRSVVLLAVGKAAQTMAAAAAARLGTHLSHGLVIYKDEGRLARQLVAQSSPDQLVVVLLSGGGSALMCDPYPGITLPMMQQLTRDLLACGADISAINTIRRRIDRVKGGGLLQAAQGTPMCTLILSDVIGNPLAAIASGPTVPNPDEAHAAWQVIEQYHMADRLHPVLFDVLHAPMTNPAVASPTYLIGDITQSIHAVTMQARTLGYTTVVVDSALTGDARHVGQWLGHIVASYHAVDTPHCIIAGGETTMTVTGSGTGGRNQELALAAAQAIAGHTNIILAAYATDGNDGPTDAAGAVASGDTMARAAAIGLNLAETLSQNNTYAWWNALGDLLMPGATGTNVNDMFVALIAPHTR
ncbi:MAG: DUF4147 domain-containing protein [Chloroflexaceae bacterium]|nr:DUF4147 domain-containing protein [Chloroflexaceae bacterium]